MYKAYFRQSKLKLVVPQLKTVVPLLLTNCDS